MKYKDSNNEWQELVVKASDTLPIGAEVDYDGDTVPYGWEEVSDPNEYSTEEQVIGTWIDGKPLYRKVITGSINGSGKHTIVHNISDIEIITGIKGVVKENDYFSPLPMGAALDAVSNYGFCVQNANASHFNLFAGAKMTGIYMYYVILEYTKTID